MLRLSLVICVLFVVVRTTVEQTFNVTNSHTTEGNSTVTLTINLANNTFDDATKSKIQTIRKVTNYIDKYGGLVILILGITGNSITLFVLSKKSMKQYAVNICLVTMTTADLLHTIVGQVGRHMIRGFHGEDPTFKSAFYCKLWYCLASYTVFYSTYALVAISMMRCVALAAPFKAKSLLTHGNVKIVCAVCAGFVGILLVHVPFAYGHVTFTSRTVCTAYTKGVSSAADYYFSKVRPWQDFLNSTLFPIALLLVSNTVTIYHLIKRKRNLQDLTGTEGVRAKPPTSSKEYGLVSLLVLVSITFIILKTPVMIMYVRTLTFVQSNQGLEGAYNALAFSIALFFNYLYHSLNFFLYNVSCAEFRTEFKKTLFCYKEPFERPAASVDVPPDTSISRISA